MLRDLSDVIKSQLGVQAPTDFPSLPVLGFLGTHKTTIDDLNLEVLHVVSVVAVDIYIHDHSCGELHLPKTPKTCEKIQKWCCYWDEEQCLRSTWWHSCTGIDVAEILSC